MYLSSLVKIFFTLEMFPIGSFILLIALATAANLTVIIILLSVISIVSNLRSFVPWRVNCWFCNSNTWVKYIKRNCWTCPKCDQYNGFTKDGDYNRILCVDTEQPPTRYNFFQRRPPKDGLCKFCNKNQQLKVTKLANFVPIDETKYDEEIESYRKRLEKAYKICNRCEIVLQRNLQNSVSFANSGMSSPKTLSKLTKQSLIKMEYYLEESLKALRISNQKRKITMNFNPFAFRKFTASPNFVTSHPQSNFYNPIRFDPPRFNNGPKHDFFNIGHTKSFRNWPLI